MRWGSVRSVLVLGAGVGMVCVAAGRAAAHPAAANGTHTQDVQQGQAEPEEMTTQDPTGPEAPEMPAPTTATDPTTDPASNDGMIPVPETQPAAVPDGMDGRRDNWLRRAGAAIQVGGGVTNFFEQETRDQTGVGGYWDARLVLGHRQLVGIEAAYVGAAQDIRALGLDDDAGLVRNGLEADLRLNLPIERGNFDLIPYVFGGLGWGNYNLVNEDFNTSSIQDSDNVLVVPLGAGLNFGYKSFIVDGRFTYRPEFGDDLLGRDDVDEDQGLNNWSLAASVGYQF